MNHRRHLAWSLFPIAAGLAGAIACSSSGDHGAGGTAASPAVAPASPAASDLMLSPSDNGAHVTLAANQQLVIALPAQPSTAMSWDIKSADFNVIALASREVTDGGANANNAAIGASTVETLRFIGVIPGQVEITLAYHRSWEDIADADATFTVTIDVAGAYSGAVPQAAPEPRNAFGTRVESSTFATRYNVCDPGDGSNSRCTPIKDQGGCGSCWAFATAGVFENLLYFQNPSRVPDLSEQYLLSCNKYGFSCNGGYVALDHYDDVFRAPETAAGAVYESELPYTGSDAPCKANYAHGEKLSGFVDVSPYAKPPAEQVAIIKQAITDHGPVWATVYVDGAFFGYTHGILRGATTPHTVNHAVVITGWDDNGGDGYWIVRNSWGPSFGEGGYLRIAYGSHSIGANAVYADYGSAPPAPPPSPPPPPPPVTAKYHLVSALDSTMCADVAGGGSSNGTNIRLWKCNGTEAQSFSLESAGSGVNTLVNAGSGKCMDVTRGSVDDGANVQLWSCHGGAPQLFQVNDAGDGFVTVVNKNSGKCVDVYRSGTASGTNILQWTCHGGTNQRWKLVRE